MFERIKCYINTKKMDKYFYGVRKLGSNIDDDVMVREASEALYLNAVLRKKMWHNPKMAEKYNLELLRKGFI